MYLPKLPQLIIFILTAVMPAFPAPAAAHGRVVELNVVDRDSGQPLHVHYRDGQAFVEGYPGQRYAIRLSNRSAGRVLAVLSVDGINAISGQNAAPDQAGYVLNPYQTTTVTGWRKSLSDVAAFEFSALADSYAARTGRPDNIGVIGIAVFHERPSLPPPRPKISHPEGEAARAHPMHPPAAARAPVDATQRSQGVQQAIGTAHGRREYSQAERVDFQRASEIPAEVVTLRYDRRDNLIAMGVITPYRHPRGPRAFPAGFVPDP